MATGLKLSYLGTAAVSGLLFGAGLYVSQMVNPFKVLRFLDFGAIPTGGWDPSLALVIAPAIVVMFLAVRLARQRSAPLFDGRFHLPSRTRIDAPLIIGSALFGLGWGMSGICPGPAISLVAFLPANLWIFLMTLALGSWLGQFVLHRPATAASETVPAE
jgi:uncharacterized membrane protein YedE/YeeE